MNRLMDKLISYGIYIGSVVMWVLVIFMLDTTTPRQVVAYTEQTYCLTATDECIACGPPFFGECPRNCRPCVPTTPTPVPTPTPTPPPVPTPRPETTVTLLKRIPIGEQWGNAANGMIASKCKSVGYEPSLPEPPVGRACVQFPNGAYIRQWLWRFTVKTERYDVLAFLSVSPDPDTGSGRSFLYSYHSETWADNNGVAEPFMPAEVVHVPPGWYVWVEVMGNTQTDTTHPAVFEAQVILWAEATTYIYPVDQ